MDIFIKIYSNYRVKDFVLLKGFPKSKTRKRYFGVKKIRAGVVFPWNNRKQSNCFCVWMNCSESPMEKLHEDAKCDVQKRAWDLEFTSTWVLQKQNLTWRSMCRRFIRKCAWDQHPWKGRKERRWEEEIELCYRILGDFSWRRGMILWWDGLSELSLDRREDRPLYAHIN